jgi:farnesyl-diphosphate farnesyltransferase
MSLAAAAFAGRSDALQALEATSRTFYLPIVRLPGGVREAVTSAYLCLRAIDEIEDHPALAPDDKVKLLNGVSLALQAQEPALGFDAVLEAAPLPRPAARRDAGPGALGVHAPEACGGSGTRRGLADRMAHWVRWRVATGGPQPLIYRRRLGGRCLGHLGLARRHPPIRPPSATAAGCRR